MFWIFIVLFSATLMTHINCDYGSPCLTPDQQDGLCMPVESCKTTFDLINSANQNGGVIPASVRDKVRSLFCGKFKNVPHVCCPESEIQLNPDGLEILKTANCGIYSVDKVSNGNKTALFEYPWMALLKYNDTLDPFQCGGSLISDQYVLTAAHCIKGKQNTLKEVRLGEYNIGTDRDCTQNRRKSQCAPPVEDIEIEEFIMHYNYHNIYNDIALIRLKRKVQFQRHIKAVCLPIYDDLRSKEYEEYIVAGWGATETGIPSDILIKAIVPRVDRNDCEQMLRKYQLRNTLDNGHICAGGRNLVDSCSGDSGGPLGHSGIYNESSVFIQFGIVEIGLVNCSAVNVPGIYTNVSYHMQWITDQLKMSVKSH